MSSSQTQSQSSSGSGSSPSPLFPSMKDKLQSSARDLMEQVMGRGKPSSGSARALESTLRAVFSSCTTGADANVTPNSEEEDYSGHKEAASPPVQQPNGTSASRVPQKELGEHIYAQLFFDDQVRAAKAVNALKEYETTAASSKKPNLPYSSQYPMQQQLPKPFPASSPARPIQQSDFDIMPTNTFDDSISAISAHTLEAMARASAAPLEQNTSFPREVPISKYDRIERMEPSPIFVPKEHALSKPYTPAFRVGSTGDQSTPSKQSQSTKTTTDDSSSFDNWQREDNKYWVDQAKKDQLVKKQRRPSHSELSRYTRSTATTAASSGRSSLHHPHDNIAGDSFFYDKEPVAVVPTGHATNVRSGRVVYNSFPTTGEI